MKKGKKILLALLSATFLATGAIGFSACKKDADRDPAIVAVYEQYVAYAEANGDAVQSYDDWIASIKGAQGDKGEKGDDGLTPSIGQNGNWFLGTTDTGVPATGPKGDQGNQGAQGDKGDAGKGIVSVTLNKEGNAWIITYTDNTTATIPIPGSSSSESHTHVYGEEKVLIAATETSDGVAYKTCTLDGCEHKELVILKKKAYAVTVKDVDGELVSGADVTINEQTAKTDENGVALISGYGDPDEYEITVAKSGYLQTANVSTTAEDRDFEVVLIKTVSKDSATIRGGGTHQVSVEVTSATDVAKLLIRVSAGDKALSYTIDLGNEAAAKVGLPGANGSSSLNVVVAANDSKQVEFVVDPLDLLGSDFAVPGTYTFNAAVTVESAPEGLEENPAVLTLGEETTFQAEADEWVYFTLINKNYEFTKGVATFGENVTLEWGKREFSYETWNYELSYIPLTKEPFGEGAEESYTFRAKATDGNISFTLNHASGTKKNPVKMEIGKTESISYNMGGNVYASYTAGETGKVVIALDSVWNYAYYGPEYSEWNGTYVQNESTYSTTYRYYVIDAEKGKTYTVALASQYPYGHANVNKCVFTLEKYDETKDYASQSLPVDLSGKTTFTQSNGEGATYYTYTAKADGRLKVGIEGAPETVKVDLYQSDKYFGTRAGSLIKKGETVYIMVTSNPTADENGGILTEAIKQYIINVEFYEFVAVENTVVVKDSAGNAVAGVEVSVAGATGTTDEKGEVKLTFVPGIHRIYVKSNETYNQYDKFMTTLPTDGSFDKGGTFNVVLDVKTTKTFTVKSGETPLSDITVKLMDGENVVASAETNASGEVSLTFFPGDYKIVLEGLNEENYAYTAMNLTHGNTETAIDVTVTAKVTYVVTVTVPSGSDWSVAGRTVNLLSGDKVVATGTTNASGVATMDTKLVPGTYAVEVEDIPEGMTCIGSTAEDSTAVTAEILNVSAVVAGGSSKNSPVSIAAGATMITNTGYVQFKALVADTYTFTISGYFDIVYVNSNDNTVYNGNYSSMAGSYVPALDSYKTNGAGLVNEFTHKLNAGQWIKFTPSEANAVVTIKGTIVEEEPPVEGELRKGENEISVTASEAWNGKEYFFTAKEAGKYTITVTSTNAYAWIENMGKPVLDGAYGVMKYEFEATAGQTVTFCFGAVTHTSGAQYTATIVKSGDLPGGDQPDPTKPVTVLSVGDNLVAATYLGTALTFTAPEDGTYTLSSGDANAYFMSQDDMEIANPYSFDLKAGQSITIKFSTADFSDSDTYTVTITKTGSGSTQTPVTELSLGDNLVAATYFGTSLTFTAEVAGTYIFSSDNTDAFFMDEGGNEISNPSEFDLEAGQSITFLFSTNVPSGEDTYTVTITNNNAR